MDIKEILKKSTIKNNILHLLDIEIERNDYLKLKKTLENAGGKWSRKEQGFVFPFEPENVIAQLVSGEETNIKKKYQFFETPDKVADLLVCVAVVAPGFDVLEPSAGQGSIVKAILRDEPDLIVDCCEILEENRKVLSKIKNVNIVGNDFLKTDFKDKKYDRIIANPPFSKNQDITHLKKMFSLLKQNGRLCCITSKHWLTSKEKKCIEFREWLSLLDYDTYEIGNEAFKASGTDIDVKVVIINNF